MVTFDGWAQGIGTENAEWCDAAPGSFPPGSAWQVSCSDIMVRLSNCCDLAVGDRVQLLVDNPGHADDLLTGALGTVLCCDSDDPDLPLLVSFDDWTLGPIGADVWCDVPPAAYPPGSGWWISCREVTRTDTTFVRGEFNNDDSVDIADAIGILGYLFGGEAAPSCMDAGDVNDDGSVDISDCIALLGFLFANRPGPEHPFPDCGPDPTHDVLDCLGSVTACR